jgi:hypothetical protein
MLYKFLLPTCFVLALAQLVSAQDARKWAVNVQLMHQDFGVDLTAGQLQTTDAVLLRPGFTAGIERTWRTSKNGRRRLFQDAHLGFWNNPYSQNYTFVGTRFASEIRLFKQLRFSPGLIYRIGRAKTTDVRYVYENNKWVPSNNSTPGFLRQQVGPEARLSYRFGANSAHPIDLQVGANFTLIVKYFPAETDPNLLVFKAYQIGMRYGL